MEASSSAAEKHNIYCTVCTEVFRSPRFLPCHHSFCLSCLEKLANKHGNVITCPNCRKPANLPPGGVKNLQRNFYLSEEELEFARSAGSDAMCPVHPELGVTLHCSQCDLNLCSMCKTAYHEGHVVEELSQLATRSKEAIGRELRRLEDYIRSLTEKTQMFQGNEKRARQARAKVHEQIEARHEEVVTMAGKHRDQALKELQEMSDGLEKDLGTVTKRVQEELNSLQQLQARAQRALSSSACNTEVLQVEREMTRGGRIKRVRDLEAGLPDTSYCPVLSSNVNDPQENIKRFIGSPVRQKVVNVSRIGRCGDGECHEVHAVREKENGIVEVFYGVSGDDFSKEKGVWFLPNGSKGQETEYKRRVSCVGHKSHIYRWTDSSARTFGSKGDRMFRIYQFPAGHCVIQSMELRQERGTEKCCARETLMRPKVRRIHNFDSSESGLFFAVVDEDAACGGHSSVREEEMDIGGSRIVSLYSKGSNDSIATYMSPKQPFFPSDVCFYDNEFLLIADQVNNCVHVAKATATNLTFVDYLADTGAIVRPTALNLDRNRYLLIGCGDGSVLRCLVKVFDM